jgi:hypothetical protein
MLPTNGLAGSDGPSSVWNKRPLHLTTSVFVSRGLPPSGRCKYTLQRSCGYPNLADQKQRSTDSKPLHFESLSWQYECTQETNSSPDDTMPEFGDPRGQETGFGATNSLPVVFLYHTNDCGRTRPMILFILACCGPVLSLDAYTTGESLV